MQLDLSVQTHFCLSSTTAAPCNYCPVNGLAASVERMLTVKPAFRDGPENDIERFELYEIMEKIYAAVLNGKTRAAPSTTAHLDQQTKRWLYQSVYEALNYRPIVEDVLNESGFYARNLELLAHTAVVHVLAYDFQRNQFTIKLPGAAPDRFHPLVIRAAEALRLHTVKLKAAAARMRVKANVRTLTELLPSDVQEKYARSQRHPLYVRVNLAKVSGNVASDIIAHLRTEGFSQVALADRALSLPRSFFHGREDLIAFSPDCRGEMDGHPLTTRGLLIIEDRRSYEFVERLRPFLEAHPGDVIFTTPNASAEALHVASILEGKGNVFVYGLNQVALDHILRQTTRLGVGNMQLFQVPFSNLQPSDQSLSKATMIICAPPSSLSNIVNTVDFVLQQGDHLLPGLSSVPKGSKLYSWEQTEMLECALKFVDVCHVVYMTHSVHPAENENIVRRVQEGQHSTHHRVISVEGAQSQEEGSLYLTVFEKLPKDPPPPPPSEVIARAIAQGIISGEGLSMQQKAQKKQKKEKRIFSRCDGIPMTIVAQKKVVKKKTTKTRHLRGFRH